MPTPLTIQLPPDLAAAVDGAVAGGAYPSADAVVQAALAQWQAHTADLKAALDEGFADFEAGRTMPFDLEHILAEGARRSARSPSG